jgi:nucleoside-diphosphate-sugar epimerase
MKTICITGLNGFIAYYVTKEALDRGYNVIGNTENGDYIYKEDFKEYGDRIKIYYNLDVRDASFMYHMIERSEGVIHLAGLLGTKNVENAWNFYDVNVRGGINVLEACKQFNIPTVFIGVGNYFETNNYSNTKYAQERECIKYSKFSGVRGNVVRALNAIGPRQKWLNTGKILPTFIMKALHNEDIQVYGGKDHCSVMDLVYAGDVAKILLNVLEKTASGEMKPASNTYQAGTGITPTVYEIAQWILDAIPESKSKIIEVPMRFGETPNSRVVADNPYPMEYRDIKDVIKEAVEYYRHV